MPGVDGPQFVARMRGHPRVAQIPIIVVSADHNAAQKADALGAVACLHKPVDLEELLALVVRHKLS